MTVEKQGQQNAFLCRLSGRFGLDEASMVGQLLATAARDAQLVLDFTRVRELPDVAMGKLAQGLQRCHAGVALRGLGLHHLRMLKYLGFDPSDRRAAAHTEA